MMGRDNLAPINTGTGDIYQTIVHQAAQPGASAADLRQDFRVPKPCLGTRYWKLCFPQRIDVSCIQP